MRLMPDILRDYGALIGPTLGFVVAVAMLRIKEGFDRRAAGKKAEMRIAKIAALLREATPPTYENPSDASDRTSAMLSNAVKFAHFYDRIAAVEGVLKSAEAPIHESDSVDLTMRYYQLKQNLEMILSERQFVRKPNPGSSPIPDEDNFFNVAQGWRSMLEAADTVSTPQK